MAQGPWARPMARRFGLVQARHSPIDIVPVLAQPNERVPGSLPWHDVLAQPGPIRNPNYTNQLLSLFLSYRTLATQLLPLPAATPRVLRAMMPRS